MYTVRILSSATRELERLDVTVGRRLVHRIQQMAADAAQHRHEALSGDLSGFYKLRIGDYRVIYELLHSEHCVLIHAIQHRRNVYRKP